MAIKLPFNGYLMAIMRPSQNTAFEEFLRGKCSGLRMLLLLGKIVGQIIGKMFINGQSMAIMVIKLPFNGHYLPFNGH